MVYIALGGNLAGPKGSPVETVAWSVAQIAQFAVKVKSVSSIYNTAPIGQVGQPLYVNAIALVETSLAPEALLSCLQKIEEMAGRSNKRLRTGGRWQARPLDLDIIDYKGRITHNYCRHSDPGRLPDRLVLPHPRAHERPFVIRPLLDVAPYWHHPVTGVSVQTLWARLCRSDAGRVLGTGAE